MADAIPLPTATSAPGEIDTRHLVLINTILTLCIRLTLEHPTLTATCNYCGAGHAFYVRLIPSGHLGYAKGGNGSYRATWSRDVFLPEDHPTTASSALAGLTEIATHLASLLAQATPGPGGAA